MTRAFRAVVDAHPRWAGLALAVLLFAAYVVALRPARVWSASSVARPAFERIETPRSRGLQIVQTDARPEAVFALPAGMTSGDIAERVQQPDVAQWVPPAGILFLLPGLFLIAAFPREPYWLYLLGYHLVVGLVSFGVFALGVAFSEAAFDLYRFSRTYLTEAVSLAVPALIWLRARASPPVAGERETPPGVEERRHDAPPPVERVVDGPEAER